MSASIIKLATRPKNTLPDDSAGKVKSPPLEYNGEPCEVIPFPTARRLHFLRSIRVEASRYFQDSIEKGESYFHALIDRHRQHLEQLGIAPARIDADVAALEDHFFDNAA